jgi:poly-gamma-glutamate system protein
MWRRIFFHHQRGYRSLAFVLVGLISIAAYAVAVHVPDGSIPGWVLNARQTAVQTDIQGQRALAAARQARGLSINAGDQFGTGLIGVDSSPITTDLGTLASARTSTDPAFGAAVVQMLFEAGVGPGDVVAVGMTGSFPGFDLAVFAGIEAVGAKPLVISSVGSTQYGANEPRFTWPVMEKALFDAGVIHSRSIAIAPGGTLAGTGAAIRARIALSSGIPILPVLPLTQDIKYREKLYQRLANEAGHPISAFIDVGGAAANVGSTSAESVITPGFSQPQWSQYQAAHLGVVGWMALQRVPIIAVIGVQQLAKNFGIPYDPTLRPTARDLAAPPADPVALITALAFILALVLCCHRAGLFRVPDWELPIALRRLTLRPSEPTGQLEAGSNGHGSPAQALAAVRSGDPLTPPTDPRKDQG